MEIKEDLFDNVKPGSRVHYLTPQGQTRSGTVVMNKGTHLVLNRGGGQPQVVTPKNYVKHSEGGKVKGALLSNLAKSMKSEASLPRTGTDEIADMEPRVQASYDMDPQLKAKLTKKLLKKRKQIVKEGSGVTVTYGGKTHLSNASIKRAMIQKGIQRKVDDESRKQLNKKQAGTMAAKKSCSCESFKVVKEALMKLVSEGRESEYRANQQLAGTSPRRKPGHYLVRNGSTLSGPHDPTDAVRKYKGMGDNTGVKIVHVKEATQPENAMDNSKDKADKVAQRAIALSKAKKLKGKTANVEPELETPTSQMSQPVLQGAEGPPNVRI